jgi:demethylmenaquinone methyltransferase / 2-methoxy-6-polyprenyl-1,4-benzoquinol methylase
VRNFQDLDTGLAEMHRVLQRGGRAVILEFTQPRNRFIRAAYELYAHRIMPRAATWLSGDRSGAYEYLPRSVVEFLSAEAMRKRLMQNGFAHVAVTPMTLGVVTIYVASRD